MICCVSMRILSEYNVFLKVGRLRSDPARHAPGIHEKNWDWDTATAISTMSISPASSSSSSSSSFSSFSYSLGRADVSAWHGWNCHISHISSALNIWKVKVAIWQEPQECHAWLVCHCKLLNDRGNQGEGIKQPCKTKGEIWDLF